jgi:hypothetical protein
MTNVISRKVAATCFALFVVYTTTYAFVPAVYLIEAMSALFCGSFAAGTVVYNRLLLQALRSVGTLNHINAMTLGMACAWLSNLGVVLYVVINRLAEYETGLLILLALVGGVLQISAANRGDSDLKIRDSRVLYTAWFVGTVAASIVISIHIIF